MLERNVSGSENGIVAGFGVVVVSVAPRADTCRFKVCGSFGVCVEQPERDVYPPYLLDMVLILKHLWQKPFAA